MLLFLKVNKTLPRPQSTDTTLALFEPMRQHQAGLFRDFPLGCKNQSNENVELIVTSFGINNRWIDQKSVPELVHQSPNENSNPQISKLLRLWEIVESESDN